MAERWGAISSDRMRADGGASGHFGKVAPSKVLATSATRDSGSQAGKPDVRLG